MKPEDILLILSPPIDFIDYLERLWEGRQPPAHWLRYLERWKSIRADGKSDIDHIQPDEWQEVGEIVGKYVTGNDMPAQATLLDVPRKVEYA